MTSSFFADDKLFVQEVDCFSVLNRLNILEYVTKAFPDTTGRYENSHIYVLDERGVFNICLGKYEVKQKMIRQFCLLNTHILFYIENKGIYIDLPDRIQVLELNNIIDMRSEFVDEIQTLMVLYQHNTGKFRLANYRFSNDITLESSSIKDKPVLKLINEDDVDNLASKILAGGAFSSKTNLLIF